MLEPVTAACLDCSLELDADSPELRVELTDDQLCMYGEHAHRRG
jgi:hypothetical protein